jgi:hypothetical protein
MLRIETITNGRRGATTVPGWAVGLAGVAALGLGLVVLTIGAGLALILAPVVAGAVYYARWRLKKALRAAGFDPTTGQPVQGGPVQGGPAAPGVIDAEYKVIDGDARR